MATKRYNKVTHTFTINGETISLYCETTNTRTGFCHHVFAWGAGMEGEHTRVSHQNRAWESYDYETAMRAAAAKYPKVIKTALLLELDVIRDNEHAKCEKWIKAFESNFNALSSEQKQFLKDHTPEITSTAQADFVAGTVALMAICK